MRHTYEELAHYFAATPIHLYGVYRTRLEGNRIYGGHVNKPTAKCAVIIALDGEACFDFDGGEQYVLKPGRILIGGAGRRLEITPSEDGFLYCLAHYLPSGAIEQGQRQNRDISCLDITLNPELLRLVDQLLNAASAPDVMDQLNQRSLFYQLVTNVLQSERYLQNEGSYLIIEDAIRYIQQHFTEPLTLSKLADRYELKAKYFSYLFTKYTGTGPIDYLIRYRMNKAHEWLLTRQFSVTTVAKSIGYSDPYYFSRLFKKYKGVAPSQVDFTSRED
ncbi:AraC family transcriptional regulator [Paenibacillus sp. MMS20-IR301]|uniref:AraC family transcriptional regulator n=1 Tax=Paenibacillus sp. MMS20-IR301 TaxID=2895946 RepID=UPI0028EAAB81|nr:AraC family transcriptional regulator [Paenibacillus sp. MMS20-IR301]WNS45712.1 AraC family transcriptional regulator [Paenibacillus sp. MMS20-IR301]